MTYVAEPYVQFVDDLLRSLTGGVVRDRFVFLDEERPYQLAPPGPVLRRSLRVHGQAGGAHRVFVADKDFALESDGVTVTFLARADGTPAAGAVWPDPATAFFASYDHAGPEGPAPRLDDRNPGSIVRLLAETFGREYAVLSRQLEAVYESAYLDTATGRDLDQVVSLVGVTRRDRTFATGSVVFARTSPAQADIFVPAGTRLSTADSPSVSFETTADSTLRRGNLSTDAPVQATAPRARGVVSAGSITVIHRPILGIQSASNPQATQLGGQTETDDALRARARRALEGSGHATTGAMLQALSSTPGVRGKDVRIAEDPILRPGLLTLHVAVPLDERLAADAVARVEAVRPAGIRVLHNLDSAASIEPATPGENGTPDDGTDGAVTTPQASAEVSAAADGLFHPVYVRAVLLPASGRLTPEERVALGRRGEETVAAFVEEAGVGEVLVYNRLVAALMALDGVLDVTLELRPAARPSSPVRRNLHPPSTLRPTVAPDEGGAIVVEIAGALVALDIDISVTTKGVLAPDLVADQVSARESVRQTVAGELRTGIVSIATITPVTLGALIASSDHYEVTDPSYTVEFLDGGVRIGERDATVVLSPLERPWIRSLRLRDDT